LVAELLGDVTGRGAGDLDPGLGEESTSGEDEDDVDDGVERIEEDLGDRLRGGDVVCNAANWDRVSGTRSLNILPATQKAHEEIGRVPLVEKLREEVDVGHEGGLKDDGDVGSVEQLDGVGALLATVLLVLDGEVDTETLEVDHGDEDQNGGEKVGDVGEILAVEGFLECAHLIGTCDEKVEKSDNGSFEFSTTTSVDGSGGEGLPDNTLTDVGGNEQRNARTKTVTLLEELVEHDNNHTSERKLEDDKDGISGAKVLDFAVHARDSVCNGLTNSDQDAEKLLCATEESAIFLEALVNLNDLGTSKKLHDHAGCYDGTNTKLHKSTPIGSEDDTHPVERVGRLRVLDTVKWDLAAHQEDEQRDDRPENLLTEGNLAIGCGHLRQHAHHRTDELKEADHGLYML